MIDEDGMNAIMCRTVQAQKRQSRESNEKPKTFFERAPCPTLFKNIQKTKTMKLVKDCCYTYSKQFNKQNTRNLIRELRSQLKAVVNVSKYIDDYLDHHHVNYKYVRVDVHSDGTFFIGMSNINTDENNENGQPVRRRVSFSQMRDLLLGKRQIDDSDGRKYSDIICNSESVIITGCKNSDEFLETLKGLKIITGYSFGDYLSKRSDDDIRNSFSTYPYPLVFKYFDRKIVSVSKVLKRGEGCTELGFDQFKQALDFVTGVLDNQNSSLGSGKSLEIKSSNNKSNQQEDGKVINLQAETHTVSKGKRFKGVGLHCERGEASITVGHLSNREVICG